MLLFCLRCQLDLEAMYMNGLTCTVLVGARIPPVMESDREAIQLCLHVCVGNDKANPRLVRIPNSLHIEHIMLSEAYLEEAARIPGLKIESEPEPWPFDADGNLPMQGGLLEF